MSSAPLLAHAILLSPTRIDEALDRIRAANIVPVTPNRWQIALGVLRMGHRIIFRSETIGTCTAHPIRATWRARLLHSRPLRFPFLLAERAVAPWDLSGLLSSKDRLFRHLLGAHHDENQFVYDLEMLAAHPGALAELQREVARVVHDDTPRSRWLRDLVVYERYHEDLLAAVEKALRGEPTLSPAEADDPDISFLAYLRWCAAQPETPAETLAALRRGEFTIAHGRASKGGSAALTLDDLLALDRAGLRRALAAGHNIDPRALDDTEYRGVSLGLPGFVERLTWKTFQKVFHRDPETGALRGWNVRIEQRGLDAPSVPLTRGGAPVTFGHYEVVGAPGERSPVRCDRGLLIDYGRGQNGRFDPTSRLRDPIVAVNPGSVDLLLGWTYVDLGASTISTPSFFALVRERALTHREASKGAPRAPRQARAVGGRRARPAS